MRIHLVNKRKIFMAKSPTLIRSEEKLQKLKMQVKEQQERIKGIRLADKAKAELLKQKKGPLQWVK